MLPGSDCVGCHRETGAKPLMFGGTVYAKATRNIYRSNAMDPLEGCFGLEGVAVKVTDGEGNEYNTVTNRAGNFYIEGQESDLVMPYGVKLNFNYLQRRRLGDRIVEGESQMGVNPYYGGCARCHTASLVAKPLDRTGFDPTPAELAEQVVPAGSVIFPTGLYPEP